VGGKKVEKDSLTPQTFADAAIYTTLYNSFPPSTLGELFYFFFRSVTAFATPFFYSAKCLN